MGPGVFEGESQQNGAVDERYEETQAAVSADYMEVERYMRMDRACLSLAMRANMYVLWTPVIKQYIGARVKATSRPPNSCCEHRCYFDL